MSFGASDFSQTSKQANPHKETTFMGIFICWKFAPNKNLCFARSRIMRLRIYERTRMRLYARYSKFSR